VDDAERRRQYRRKPEVKERQREHFAAYMDKPDAMQKMAEAVQKWRRANPEKKRAHDAVERALRRGSLLRKPCEVCGGKAEAHHDDYSKPLEVRWLCRAHHKAAHQNYSGDLAGLS
jgi:ferric-dicitrate binding protein FerR (iron transport regulator)